LIFKEAVNNAVRHSGCTQAEIAFEVEGRSLTLRVEDDGRGFDPESGGDGHGLDSMRRRAEGLGGTLDLKTAPGEGVTVTLRAPL
jgi:signal transduction histidine kinase